MKYRTFKGINEKVSLLGMGCMRFPMKDDKNVDEDEAVKIIRHAIDSGVNYVDTGYKYHGGRSEVILGNALKDGYREKVLLADKMPIWLARSQDDCRKYFNEQLKRLDVDCIDMYLVHNITRGNWKIAKKHNLMDFLEEMRAEGKIKYIGFSFHDSLEFFKEMLDEYPWDFCQIQLNYMDKNHQAGVEGLKYASNKGLGVVIMEPLKGGRITDFIPPAIEKLWQAADTKRTPAEWAFKWLAHMPEVTVMLSGMSSMEQLNENISILSADDVEELNEKELTTIDKVSDEYNRLIKYSCTGCQYCIPCPQKLDIPRIIGWLNDWNIYEHNPSTKFEYITWQAKHASDCIGCKACEEKCPQHLRIADAMSDAAEAFGI